MSTKTKQDNYESIMSADLKVYLTNLGAFSVSMTNIDAMLKITLLAVSIGYTVHRWYIMSKNNDK